jgi:hypothetical protein
MRNQAEKRHNDWKKAIRKRNITRSRNWDDEHYDNLHQYSKNTIHCPAMCREKTNNRGRHTWGPNYNPKTSEARKNASLDDDYNDFLEEREED